MPPLPLSAYLYLLGFFILRFCFSLCVLYLVCFALQAAAEQRQSRKRFLDAFEDLSRAEACSKKMKMDRIIAKTTVEVQKADIEQETLRMAAMHAMFMPRTP
jgi:hypothetical protein